MLLKLELSFYDQMFFFSIQGGRRERLVSGSDDFTLFLWDPEESKKPLARMTGQISGYTCIQIRDV